MPRKASARDVDDQTQVGNFESLLDMQKDDLPEPKLVPTGTWRLKAKSAKFYPNDEDETKGRVSFYMTPIEPVEDDVDPDEVAEGEWKGELVDRTFFINKKSDMRDVADFLERVGVEFDNIREGLIEFTKSKPELVATIGTRSWTDTATGQPRSVNTVSNVSAAE